MYFARPVQTKMENRAEEKLLKYARRGRLRQLVRSLDQNVSPNCRDERGRSALYLASLGGHKECIKELLRRGADPNMSVWELQLLSVLTYIAHTRTTSELLPCMCAHIQPGQRWSCSGSCSCPGWETTQLSTGHCSHQKPLSWHLSLSEGHLQPRPLLRP